MEQGLQETIGCLCAVVNNLTRDYERIIKILSSCVGETKMNLFPPRSVLTLDRISLFANSAKLEAVRREFKASGALPPEQRTFAPMLFIVACLGEHCDFDEIRSISAGTVLPAPRFFGTRRLRFSFACSIV
jgi:cohesin loading factor subunit SCC2